MPWHTSVPLDIVRCAVDYTKNYMKLIKCHFIIFLVNGVPLFCAVAQKKVNKSRFYLGSDSNPGLIMEAS